MEKRGGWTYHCPVVKAVAEVGDVDTMSGLVGVGLSRGDVFLVFLDAWVQEVVV